MISNYLKYSLYKLQMQFLIVNKELSYNIDHYRYLFYEKYNVLEKYENLSKWVMYLIALFSS